MEKIEPPFQGKTSLTVTSRGYWFSDSHPKRV